LPVQIDGPLLQGLRRLGEAAGATLYMTLLAGFQALLSRYSGQKEVSVGTAVANRTRTETEGLIGFFVNTLVQRAELGDDPAFEALLARVKALSLGAMAHQAAPFEQVVQAVAPERDPSRAPLFQAFFVLQTTPPLQWSDEALQLELLDLPAGTAKFDLSLSLAPRGAELVGRLEFATALFDRSTVARLWRSYLNLLAGAVEDPRRPISALPLLDEVWERHLVRELNDTQHQTERPLPSGLGELLRDPARWLGQKVAVEFEGQSLSYAALEARSSQLAHRLKKLGVGPEVRVGVCCERSLELIVGLFGALKAGAAYVPLDPDYPEERLAYIARDAGLSLILAAGPTTPLAQRLGPQVVALDAVDLEPEPKQAPPLMVHPDGLAYIIYTSGSTGRPKGAMNSHRAVLNRLAWIAETYGYGPEDVILQKTSIGFDVSVGELFLPFLIGARLVLARPGGHRDPEYLAEVLRTRGITSVHFVPSMFRAMLLEPRLLQEAVSLRRVLASGEALPVDLVERFQRITSVPLHNLYGPTEAAIEVSAWTCTPDDPARAAIPIGKPIWNVHLLVLDDALRPVPEGVVGELYIGGVAVGRGYWGRPELTAERFVPDPYTPGGRLYRTGDRARLLESGDLLYLGRADGQVKLRGYRIELEEIEVNLRAHPDVKDAAVLLREDHPGDPRLVGYVESARDAGGLLPELRAQLLRFLPEHMVPSAWLVLPQLPLTGSGKLDRRALPAPEATHPQAAGEPPRTPLERQIAALWREILGREEVGAHDNFFDLGGHSLQATRVVSRLRSELGVELPLRAIFERPRLSNLAGHLEGLMATRPSAPLPPLLPGPRDPAGEPLSFAQQRLWFLEQLAPGQSHYHVPAAVELRGPLALESLRRAFQQVVERHQILRSRIVEVDGRARQEVFDAPHFELPVARVPAESWESVAAEELRRPFDLHGGLLLRAKLIEVGEARRILLLTMHHLASDGWSLSVLVKELAQAYSELVRGREPQLPELPIQYVDYARWQRAAAESGRWSEQLAYWKRRLADSAAQPGLPTDRPRPPVQDVRGTALRVRLPAPLLGRLRALSEQEGATLFMTLLAGFQALLGRWSGQEDISVGTPVANRTRIETEGLIGFFVNTLVQRVDLSGDPNFRELLARVRSGAVDAWAHQDVPFEQVVNAVAPPRDRARTPLFQVLFVLQNATELVARAGELELQVVDLPTTASKFDLTLSLREADGELHGNFELATALYEPATIERLWAVYLELLEQVVAKPESRYSTWPAVPREPTPPNSGPGPSGGGGLVRPPPASVAQRVAQQVTQVWEEALRQGGLESNHNFFELGGHSLLAMEVAARLRGVLGRPVPLGLIFEHPTLGGLVQALSADPDAPSEPPAPIPRRPRGPEGLPLSPDQRRLHWLEALEPGTAQNHVPVFLRIKGPLSAAALDRALHTLAERHEVLRARIGAAGAEPRCHFDVALPRPMLVVGAPLRGATEATLRAFAELPFDLERGPLWRAGCWPGPGPEEQILGLVFHHLIIDGPSIQLLFQDLDLILAGATLPVPTLGYGDFAAWAAEEAASGAAQRALDWWSQALAELPVLELPLDHPRPAVFQLSGAEVPITGAASVRAGVEALARRQGATPFMVHLAAYAAILGRYSGASEVAIGVPVSGRSRPELRGIVGLFANTLVLRIPLGGDPDFETLLARVRERVLAAFAHQEAPFAELVRRLERSRDPSRTPLFQAMFSYQEPRPLSASSGLSIEPLELPSRSAKFELTLSLVDRGELRGNFEYATTLFEAGTIERIADDFLSLLNEAVLDPKQPVGAMARAPRADLRLTSPAPGGLIEALEAARQRAQGRPAVIVGDDQLSYPELYGWADQIAERLSGEGIGAETPVGVLLPKEPGYLAAILGVLRAGGAFVPLDPNYPEGWLAKAVESAGLRVVLTHPALAVRLPPTVRVVHLPERREAPVAWTPRPRLDDGLAYLILTSGTTGTPKAVAVSDRALLGSTRDRTPAYGRVPDRYLVTAPFAFDASLAGLFWCLLEGTTVVIPSEEEAHDLGALHRRIEHERVSHVDVVPGLLRALLEVRPGEGWSSVQVLIVGGEVCPPALVAKVLSQLPQVELYNEYGPTEATIWATLQRVTAVPAPGQSVPIGRAIAGLEARILDAELRPVPEGVAGELYLGGAWLARGYHLQPSATAAAFLPDPEARHPGARLYRTGDRARRTKDGALELLDRVDRQVKVRGVRLELGAIERALEAQPGVEQAAVVLLPTGQLWAAVTGATSAAILQANLQESRELPEVARPSVIEVWPDLPRTPTGKVDRAALLSRAQVRPDVSLSQAPVTPTERVLAELWRELLGLEQVGRDTHFFAAGGHSLLAMQLGARVEEQLQRSLPLRLVFEHPTLAALAAQLDRLGPSELKAAPITKAAGPPIASFAQERALVLESLGLPAGTYAMPMAVWLGGPLDVARLREALSAEVRRHPALRTAIFWRDGKVETQAFEAWPGVGWSLTFAATEAQAREELQASLQEPYDLTRGEVFRVRLWRAEDTGRHLLCLGVHHAAADGWSLRILLQEILASYAGAPPTVDLPIDYGDFAAWQRAHLRSPHLEQQRRYWQTTLEGAPPALVLPVDPEAPGRAADGSGAIVPLSLPTALGAELKALADRLGVTLYTVLVSAWALVLARSGGQAEVVVGTPVSGRTRRELEPLVGNFVNTLPLRFRWEGERSAAEWLVQAAAPVVMGALDAQDYPFDRIVADLAPERSLSPAPVFGALFFHDQTPEWPVHPLQLEPLRLHTGTAKAELTLAIDEGPGPVLTGVLEYDRGRHSPRVAQLLLERYRRLLESWVHDPSRRLAELHLDEAPASSGFAAPLALGPSVDAQVRRWAKERPEAVAIRTTTETWSYQRLHRRAGQVAQAIAQIALLPESVVAVRMPRTPEALAVLLGVWRAGHAYLPIDPGVPEARARALLEAANAQLILDGTGTGGTWPPGCAVLLPEDWRAIAPVDWRAPAGHRLAYVLFTSGSTGTPKGVAISHQSLAQLLQGLIERLALNAADRVVANTTFTFDIAALELWAPLWVGAEVALLDEEQRLGAPLRAALEQLGPTVLQGTPTFFRMLLESGWDQRVASLLVGGEAWDLELARRLLPRCEHLFNVYGPTETTVWSTIAEVDPRAGALELGQPLPGERLHVLDADLRPLPLGAEGELYLGGVGLARGYLGAPMATAAAFIPDPFSGEAGARLYRTGDRVLLHLDGRLEYRGRVDQQLKIRGHRIEPAEIEAALVAQPGVEAAAVVAVGEGAHRRLFAAVVVRNDGPSGPELRRSLAAQLPEYLVPAEVRVVDALPQTSSGKLDRRSVMNLASIEAEVAAPRAPESPLEVLVVAELEQVLARAPVGVDESFFELGGHSLLALQLAERLSRHGWATSLRDVFEAPTAQALARRLSARGEAPKVMASEEGEWTLAPHQRQVWLSQRLEPESAAYHMPVAARVPGLVVEWLEQALVALEERHPLLRVVYRGAEGRPVPDQAHLGLERHTAQAGQALALVDLLSRRPFQLDTQSPLAVHVIEEAGAAPVVLLNLHHLAGDATTLSTLLRDLLALYRGEHLPPTDPQPAFLRFAREAAARWQDAAPATRVRLTEALGALPSLSELLPPPPRTFEGSAVGVAAELDPEEVRRLLVLAGEWGASPYLLHLALLSSALDRLTGGRPLGLGAVVTLREDGAEVGPAGFYANTVVLRSEGAHRGLAAAVEESRARFLDAFEDKEVPFGEVLAASRRGGGAELASVVFVHGRSAFDAKSLREQLGVEDLPVPPGPAKFPLTFFVEESHERTSLRVEVDPRRIDPQVAPALLGIYRALLTAGLSDPQRDLRSVDLPDSVALGAPADAAEGGALGVRFFRTAEAHPTRWALVADDRSITYQDLAQAVRGAATLLLQAGLQKGERIALVLPPGLLSVTWTLAGVAIGAVVTPLEPTLPAERRRTLCQLARCQRIIQAPGVEPSGLVWPSPEWDQLHAAGVLGAPLPEVEPEALAYLVFTSGSTGAPKGILQSHRAFDQFLGWQAEACDFGPGARVAMWAPSGYDAALCELLGALLFGATLVVPRPEVRSDPRAALAWLEAQAITTFQTVPTYLSYLLRDAPPEGGLLPALRVLMLAGEVLSPRLVERLDRALGPAARIYNLYGPSECVLATAYPVPRDGRWGERKVVPIGRPIAGRRITLRSEAGGTVSPQAIGELWVESHHLTSGYLDPNDDLGRFFGAGPLRAYRTGDRVALGAEGELIFVGRDDEQRKIRGNRVELSEIESTLSSLDGVSAAAARLVEVSRDRVSLVAYYEAAGTIDGEALWRHCLERLPHYMVPSRFLRVEGLPRNSGGKLDRRAIAAWPLPPEEHLPPRPGLESQLHQLWAQVLGHEDFGIDSNFFDVGGDSASLVRLFERLPAELKPNSVVVMFQRPTIRAMAQVDGDRGAIRRPVERQAERLRQIAQRRRPQKEDP
jgi:amino acid adenylation domain-containing protein